MQMQASRPGASSSSCIFCKIVRGEIQTRKIYEDSDILAFLDINPANPGHTLVVPKRHTEDIMTTADEDLKKSITVVKAVAKKLRENMGAVGVNVLQNNGKHAGQLVDHIHFHVIPRYPNDGFIISYQRVDVSEAEMESIWKKLSDEASSHGDSMEFDI